MEGTGYSVNASVVRGDVESQPTQAQSRERSPLLRHGGASGSRRGVSCTPRRTAIWTAWLACVGVSAGVCSLALNHRHKASASVAGSHGLPQWLFGAKASNKVYRSLEEAQAEHHFESGLISVNETDGSKMFYWYFPPQSGNTSAPFILWLQGGPGASCLIGLFDEVGPFSINKAEREGWELIPREATWTKHFHVLFVDNPVGTGYSFAGSPEGYATNEHTVADGLYTLLRSFFSDHKHLVRNDFYIVAESYGGHYGPELASHIFRMNKLKETQPEQHKDTIHINLSGLAIQDGLVDPPIQVLHKPSAAYFFGLINEVQLEEAKKLAHQASELALGGKYVQARDVRTQMEAYIREISGVNLMDIRVFGVLGVNQELHGWANDPANKKALNLPANIHWKTSQDVQGDLSKDVMKSYADKVEDLLEVHKLKVLTFQGQFDLKDGVRANQAWIYRMRWSGRDAFLHSPYKIWYTDDDITKPSGWAQESGLLTEVVVAAAGHLIPLTQPERGLDCIKRWIEGRPFQPLLPNDTPKRDIDTHPRTDTENNN